MTCLLLEAEDDKEKFRTALHSWYLESGRVFPWRLTSDSFAVLIAEKLLQRTVARPAVVAAYQRIVEAYSPSALANAVPANIRTIILPLGLDYRADELVALAQALEERHGGRVPPDKQQLLVLPGVGEYCARAVLSFAFDKPVLIVDANIARLSYRLCGIQQPLPANRPRSRQLYQIVDGLPLTKEFDSSTSHC